MYSTQRCNGRRNNVYSFFLKKKKNNRDKEGTCFIPLFAPFYPLAVVVEFVVGSKAKSNAYVCTLYFFFFFFNCSSVSFRVFVRGRKQTCSQPERRDGPRPSSGNANVCVLVSLRAGCALRSHSFFLGLSCR